MSILGSTKASIFAASNENSVAFANAKFDFSLVKVEVHPDFAAVGPALTQRRRCEAEAGSQHKVARRLAVLFEQLIPSTPKLISVYGKRVSEILKTPGVNPGGRTKDGPFEDYIGADGTAIWAAATSGTPALGVFLLACLLAHEWDSKIAISIWVELVETRKKQIIDAFERHEIVSQSSLLGAQQDFSRDELAEWDDSARAWLRCTEKAKKWERCQHMLISRNISLVFPTAPNTYDKVMLAWQSAMTGLEDLLCERPQMLTDAALMRASQAWSIYPDMIVLGKEATKVRFGDALVPSNAVVTIGSLENPSSLGSSKWSLTLSHLRYYGRPKAVRSESDPTRICRDTLRLMAFGALLGYWHLHASDIRPAAEFVVEIWKRIGATNQALAREKSKYLPWLGYLEATAQLLLLAHGEKYEEYVQVMYWGQRRAKSLLSSQPGRTFPFFGLSSEDVMCSLSKNHDADCGIAYLRIIAARLRVEARHAFIVYSYDKVGHMSSRPRALEFATVAPHSASTASHLRWLIVDNSIAKQDWKSREEQIQAQNEQVSYEPMCAKKYRDDEDCCLTNLPSYFHTCGKSNVFHDEDSAITDSTMACNCGAEFEAILGNGSFGLYVTRSFQNHISGAESFQKFKHRFREQLKPEEAVNRFQTQYISETQLWNYLCLVGGKLPKSKQNLDRLRYDLKALQSVAEGERHDESTIQSLHALEMVSRILKNTGDVSISPRVISVPIHSAPWIPKGPQEVSSDQNLPSSLVQENVICPGILSKPNLQEIFSCIAYLETGSTMVPPQYLRWVFALCCGNSIYVARRVLTDPADMDEDDQVHQLVGNIGQPGISFLIAPYKPETRDLSDDYRIVSHSPYDHRREDNFKSTSLHLSFSNWSLPLNTDTHRHIDKDIKYVEAVVQAFEGAKWVADLDIMKIPFDKITRLEAPCTCSKNISSDQVDPLTERPASKRFSSESGIRTIAATKKDYVSLDSWEELLDPPLVNSVGVFRAHGNWAARLAAVSILTQKGQAHSIGLIQKTHSFCLPCAESTYGEKYGQLGESESGLPSVCVD